MPAALGSSSSSSSAAVRTLMRRDIRDYGARPGSANAVATRQAIYAALASLDVSLVPLRGSGAWGQIYIPGDPDGYYIDRPIVIDQTYIEFLGDGMTSKLKNAPLNDGAVLMFGMPLRPQGQALTSDHLVDLYGKLDTSAASAAGQRYGFWIKHTTSLGLPTPDGVVVQGSGPINYGPVGAGPTYYPGYWADCRQFTVEFAVEWASGDLPHNGPYFGMSRAGHPMPWFLFGGDAGFLFYFRTFDGTYDGGLNGGTDRAINFSAGSSLGIKRIAIQLDLVNAQCQVWVNGVQVTATVPDPGGTFISASNLRLVQNTNYPFMLGNLHQAGNQLISEFFTYTGSFNRRFYGFKVTKGLRYANDGVGTAQRRNDAGAVNDFESYFNTGTTNMVACFPMQDTPSDVAANRLVKVQCGNAALGHYSHAFFTSANHSSPFSAMHYYRVHDLQILNTPGWAYGDAILFGYALHVDIQECKIKGGAHGIGIWNWGANYVNRVSFCELDGTDASIYNNYGIMELDSITVGHHGRSTLWFGNGAVVTGAKFFMPENTATVEHVVRCVGGCNVVLDGLGADFEGGGPSVSAVYAETGGSSGVGGRLILKDVGFGTIADRTPFVILHDVIGGADLPPSEFQLKGALLVEGDYGPLVQTDGPGWTGEVETAIYHDQPQVENVGTFPGPGVRSIHSQFIGPPRYGKWTRNGHILRVTSAADGQYQEWRCVGSGRCGTATPPAWAGMMPNDCGPNGLAAYLFGHSYWGVSGVIQGFWTDYVQVAWVNFLFKGTALPTAPATTYIGLSTRKPYREGVVTEVTGGSYARVATTASNWAASSGGATSNATAITFPTATANWSNIRTIFLSDAPAGGNCLAQIEVPTFTVSSGSALTYAIGALTVGHSAASTGRPQAFSAYVADKVNNFWLRATSPGSAPTLFLALSTTAANPAVGPTEPAGGGYARVSAGAANWATAKRFTTHPRVAETTNAAALAFPAPTGSWGTIKSVYLMDASSAGNVIAAADLTVQRSPVSGEPAPAFSVGSLWATRS